MAKRKKHRTYRPRRRISGTGKIADAAMVFAGAVIGGVGARVASTMIMEKVKVNPMVVAGIEIGTGIMVLNHFKQPIVKGIGIGIGVEGSTHIFQKMGVIKGVEDVDVPMGDDEVSGDNYLQDTVAGEGYLTDTVAGY